MSIQKTISQKILFCLVIIFSIFYFFFITNTINFNKPSSYIFNTPDEASNYQVLNQYVSTGEFHLIDKYSLYDKGNNLHSRGFILWNEKIVPFSFLGLPFFYGPLYSLLGNNLQLIGYFFFLVTAIFLIKIIFLLFKNKINKRLVTGYSLIALLAGFQIFYWFSFPYLNLLGAVTFFIVSFYYLLKFNEEKFFTFLFLSILFALISIWFRYDYVIFFFLIFIINFIKNKKDYLNQNKILLKILIFLFVFLIAFLVPISILNYKLYGSFLEYGYKVSNMIFFQEERASSFGKIILNIFLPGGEFNISHLLTNIKTSLFLLSPLFFLFSYLSFIRMEKKKFWPYLIIPIYVLFYSGMSATFGSGDSSVTLDKSVVRYWILIYIMLMIPFISYLNNIQKRQKVVLILLIFYLMIPSTYLLEGVNQYYSAITSASLEIEFIKEIEAPDYILTAREDKYLYSISKPITWWCVDPPNCDSLFNSESISNLIKILIDNGELVYLKSSVSLDQNKINQLSEQGLRFDLLSDRFKVYKISSSPTNETQN